MARTLREAFHDQRRMAEQRGIPFLLDFDEWFTIWDDSGHLPERGVGKGKWCMARFGDKGPYATWNVKIILHTENTSEGHKGKVLSQEQRAKLSEAGKGRFVTLETREKLSRNGIGRKHSPEAKAKISAAAKKRKYSLETRKKMSEASKRRKHSLEVRMKISVANKGRVVTLKERIARSERKRMPILCVNDSREFRSIEEAAKFYKISTWKVRAHPEVYQKIQKG